MQCKENQGGRLGTTILDPVRVWKTDTNETQSNDLHLLLRVPGTCRPVSLIDNMWGFLNYSIDRNSHTSILWVLVSRCVILRWRFMGQIDWKIGFFRA